MNIDSISAAERIRKLFDQTPCAKNLHLSNKYAAEIWLKREDLSPVRSYKLRGAWNAMIRAREKAPEIELFVCASAGNHAQGVAFACERLGVNGVVFMPVTTPQQKIEKTRVFGGRNIEIRLVGDYFDDTLRAAQAFCREKKGHFLAPFDDAAVIEGQSTVLVEALAQMPTLPDVVVLPVGGGGLAAGSVSYLNQISPDTEVYFVEPEGGMSLVAALEAGAPIDLANVDSFVDGAAVAKIGELPFSTLKDVSIDQVLACPEDRICATMIELLNIEGIVLEPAGALAIDALQEISEKISGKRVLCVASGGNFDFERLPEVKERAQRYRQLKKYYILRMPQRPGALKDFLDLLGPEDDIARFEYLKKSARNFGSVLIGIETKDPANFPLLEDKMLVAGLSYRNISDDEALAEYIL